MRQRSYRKRMYTVQAVTANCQKKVGNQLKCADMNFLSAKQTPNSFEPLTMKNLQTMLFFETARLRDNLLLPNHYHLHQLLLKKQTTTDYCNGYIHLFTVYI